MVDPESQFGVVTEELSALARTDVSVRDFFDELLEQIDTAIDFNGAVVWFLNDGERFESVSDTGDGVPGNLSPRFATYHQLLLWDVFGGESARQFDAAQSTARPDHVERHQLPLADCVFAAPIRRNGKPCGVLEIFQADNDQDDDYPANREFIAQIAAIASDFLDRRSDDELPGSDAGDAERWSELLLQLHESTKVADVTATAATDGRTLLGCDRLSVAIRHGGKVRVAAVSGQAAVNQRSNLIRQLTAITLQVVRTREPFHFNGDVEDLPPQLERPLADYIRTSGARALSIVPLFQADASKRNRNPKQRKIAGAMVAEQILSSRFAADFDRHYAELSDHVASSLSNAQRFDGIFLVSLWRALGRLRESAWRYGLLAGTLLLVGLAALLTQVVTDYRIEADGRLMPVERRAIFCPLDGQVAELSVTSGQRVGIGQPLLRIHNEDIETRRLTLQGSINELQQLQAALEVELGEAVQSESRVDELRLQGQLASRKLEIQSTREQLAVIEGRFDKLVVRSPIGGVVATFRIDELLLNRPVYRGDMLLEVMDDRGPWRLELEIPDRRIGHVLDAQAANTDSQLPVDYALASVPGATWRADLVRIATSADVSETAGVVVGAYASLDANEPPALTIGTEVRARIHCGRRKLGYVLFGDIIEFVQRQFWWHY